MEVLTFSVVLVAIVGTIIKIGLKERHRKQVQNQLIAYGIRHMNYKIPFGLFVLILSIIGIYFTWLRVLETYQVLVEAELISTMWELFDPRVIENVTDYAFRNEMMWELFTVTTFRNHVLGLFIFIILAFFYSIVFLYFGLQKTIISQDQLSHQGKLFNWDEVKGYKWFGYQNGRTLEGKRDHYNLSIYVKRNKWEAKLLNEDTKSLDIKINPKDKETVDKFLANTVTH